MRPFIWFFLIKTYIESFIDLFLSHMPLIDFFIVSSCYDDFFSGKGSDIIAAKPQIVFFTLSQTDHLS